MLINIWVIVSIYCLIFGSLMLIFFGVGILDIIEKILISLTMALIFSLLIFLIIDSQLHAALKSWLIQNHAYKDCKSCEYKIKPIKYMQSDGTFVDKTAYIFENCEVGSNEWKNMHDFLTR
jgi:hypothetical protein